MRYVLIVHLFELVDVTIFFLKTGSKLEKFDLGQVKSIIWTEGVEFVLVVLTIVV